MRLYPAFKRQMDFICALILLIVLLPLLAGTALFILLFSGRPVLFRQTRSGCSGKPFTILKFRTMEQADTNDFSTRRITFPGRLLRRCGLDELPQLLNILKGEMSFVGPRPLPCDYLPLYTARQARRLQMPPGLTGWAQVNGRNAVSWENRLKMDSWYVEHAGFRLDCHILLMTVGCVVRGVGVNHCAEMTMPPFEATRDASLLILGAGGHGRVIAETAQRAGLYKRIAFLDDSGASECGGFAILGCFNEYTRFADRFADATVALGDNMMRLSWLRRLEEAGYRLPVLIHPSAVVGRGAVIGKGSVVLSGAVVVTGAALGIGCIVNTLAGVDHDCRLGDGVHICPGAHLAGSVQIGELTTVYTGASAANNVKIGARSRVAAGAAVVHDLPCNVLAAGIPAVVKKQPDSISAKHPGKA